MTIENPKHDISPKDKEHSGQPDTNLDHQKIAEEYDNHIKETKAKLDEMEQRGATPEEIEMYLDYNLANMSDHEKPQDVFPSHEAPDTRIQETLVLLGDKVPKNFAIPLMKKRVSDASPGYSAAIVEHIYQAAIDTEQDVKKIFPGKIGEYLLG